MPDRSTYERLRSDIASMPVIHSHAHSSGPANAPAYADALIALSHGYAQGDLRTVASERDVAFIRDPSRPLDERCRRFVELWPLMEQTGYARVTKRLLRDLYGESDVTEAALERIGRVLPDLRDEATYRGIVTDSGVRCRIVNNWIDMSERLDIARFLDGLGLLDGVDRFVIPLPEYHAVRCLGDVERLGGQLGRSETTLDGYLDACAGIFRHMKDRGAVAIKDQSAYSRSLGYDSTTRKVAERLFARISDDPRERLGWPEAKPLDDFLFHSFMRVARDLDLPVQLHTGLVMGGTDAISEADAVRLTNVLELHRDVRFDLFHGNWPFEGMWLYLAKNYPNVALNFCWAHMVDPRYAEKTLLRAIVTVPHAKLHGFGSDYADVVEYAAAHLEIARDNIAAALAAHVGSGWLGHGEATQVAADMLHNSPNRFYRLGYDSI